MKRLFVRPGVLIIISLLTVFAVAGSGIANPAQSSGQVEIAPSSTLLKMALPGTRDLQLIIQLSSPSLVEHIRKQERNTASSGRSLERRRMDFQSPLAQSHRTRLAREHREMLRRLSNVRNLRAEGTLDTVMNAVIARVPVERYSEIRKMAGIKKIYFSRPQHLLLNAAANVLNAQTLWNHFTGGRQNAGQGIKIGIIDTGIDITNPMFTDTATTLPSGYPLGESTYTNHKVIVARNYIGLLSQKQTVQSAIDEVGHGTFVAGAAAGKVVNTPAGVTISGMAPGAFLGSYKVFGTPGVNDSTTTAAVLTAINDAVADGMDVINLSFGGLDYAVPSEDPECLAVENAIQSGVVVAIAAGNEGPSTRTISTPGTTPDAITVGSVSNSHAFYAQIHTTAPAPVPSNLANIPYVPGDGPKVSSNMDSTGIVDVALVDVNGLGLACSSLPIFSLSGQIALISRGGGCLFSTKVNNASAAGAVAVVIYNNDPATGIPSMGGLSSTTIPAVAISNSNGLLLKQFVDNNQRTAKVSIDNYQSLTETAATAGVISSFSSVGPGTDFSIKPDLVAVGENVYSAAESTSAGGILYSQNQFAVASGTSFSTPMVAGAAACLQEMHPGLSVQGIKSLLVNTAGQNVTSGSSTASILQMGSGLMNMGAASAAGAVFAPTSLTFGPQSYSGSLTLTRSLTITNISSTTDQYTISISPVISGPNIAPSAAGTGQVAPNQEVTITINLQITAPSSGGFTGFVEVKSANSSMVYHIPYWAGLYVPDSSQVLTVGKSGGSFSSLTAALASARPGNTIEIDDSGTYSEEVVVNTNAEGLPLHGITIRAQPGQQPVLDGSGASLAGIQIIGLQNVLLQGLTINGGPIAALIWQPGSVFPTSATIDKCTATNVAGSGSAAVGVLAEGAEVDLTNSNVSGSTGTGIFADSGSYLTVFNTTVQNNGNDGMDAISSNVDILDSNISNNTGAGLYLESCTGTVMGNTISGNAGALGDGAYVTADSTLRFTENTFSSNDRAGLALLPNSGSTIGGGFTFEGNTVAGSKAYGIYASGGQNATFDGNLIKDNSIGVRLTGSSNALFVNNIVTRSNSTTSGDGLEVAGSSNAKIVNDTIYKSSQYGITLSSSGTVSVRNTIVSTSGTADIQAPSTSAISFSLIGDSSFTAVNNNNISGNPGFSNPDLDDYSLTPSSPALNSGSPADLPFLDYYGRLRTAGSKVDMGAIEANSSFPLAVPILANGTQPLWQGGLQTAFSIYNGSNGDSSAGFVPYGSKGDLLAPGSTITQSIGYGSTFPILGSELFSFNPGQNVLGSLLINGTQPMKGFYLLTDSSFQQFATTVNASDQALTELVFPYHRNDSSGYVKYVLFNPGPDSASVEAQLYSSSGSLLSSNTMTIAAKGQSIFAFDNITTVSGFVYVQSSRPLTGAELLGDTDKLVALAAQTIGSESRLFFPFFAVNQSYSNTIGIVNPAATTANMVLTAYGPDGRQLGNSVSLSLNPNAQLLESVSQLFGIAGSQLTTGYIVAKGDQPGITGFVEQAFGDIVHSAAAIPADSVPHKKLVFSDIAHQVPSGSGTYYETGLVLMNPLATAVQYTMKVYDGSGNQVAAMTGTLAPGEMTARMLSHPAGAGFFTQSISLASGHIEVQSDHPLFGLETLFTDDLSIMILTLPQQTEE